MAAKTAWEIALEFAQSALNAAPVIILGSGASAAHGVPGMGPLADHLGAAAEPTMWTADERVEWNKFLTQLKAGKDLETALQAVRPTERQTQYIASLTRLFLMPSDLNALNELLADRRALPLSRLFKHAFTSTHRIIHVVTPNYDRLAEYAADAAEFGAFTGFSHGYLQTRAKQVDAQVAMKGEATRTVCIWKVHGSLDWFQDSQNQIIGIRNGLEAPTGYQPLMITPGIDKYRLTHGEPFRTILACCDKALEGARAYFCVGYGFNDEHVQTKLVERCDRDSVPLLVITKQLTLTARAFLSGGRCRRYLALEESASGVRAYTHTDPSGFDVPGDAIWKLDRFLDTAIGADT